MSKYVKDYHTALEEHEEWKYEVEHAEKILEEVKDKYFGSIMGSKEHSNYKKEYMNSLENLDMMTYRKNEAFAEVNLRRGQYLKSKENDNV